jgi:hypothetical protein
VIPPAKIDNSSVPAKLALRRYFLKRYHADRPPHVIDCCVGEGVLWGRLRKEFAVASYLPIDKKNIPGRLRVNDSARILELPGLRADVIDVDTYGLPWRHWIAIIRGMDRPTTVFLTIGRLFMAGGSRLSREEADALGLSFRKLKLPTSLSGRLCPLAIDRLLGLAPANGLRVIEAREVSGHHVQYVGVRLDLPVAS